MADNELKIVVTVDGSQLSGGLSQAAATVESASGKMAASLKSTGLSSTEAASAMKNLGFSASETSTALQNAGLVATEAASKVEATTAAVTSLDRSMALAAGRIVGFSAGAGMLGGSLARVAAASSTIGPLLAAAFPVIGAIAILDILSKIPEVFKDIVDSLAGWDAAAKKTYADLISSNTEMLLEVAKLKVEINALNEIGVKGVEKYAIAAKDNVAALKIWAGASAELLHEQESLNAELKKLSNGGYAAYDWIAKTLNHERIAEIHTELENVAKALQTIDKTQRSLAGVAAPKIVREGEAARVEEERKALENLAREREKEGKEAEDAALKRADAERRAAEQKERFDEEIAADSEAMLKRDVESYERALVLKTSIAEREGKNVLSQIQENAELAQKAIAQKTVQGAANPAISQEALAAYQQETAVLQQLVALEGDLQQKLIATGAAQDDPKVLESQRRQLELTQQISKAWDDYEKKIQQVSAAQTALVKQETSSLFSSINSNLVSMVNGQESIVRGIQSIWTGFVDSLIVDFAKLGEKWVEEHLIMAAVSKLFHLQDATNAVASAAAATAASKVAGMAQVGLAGAGGVASMAAAPFPIDLTAPAFGAAMMASAASMLAFDTGGVIPGPGPTPAIMHGGEWVLNEVQQRALGSGGSSSSGEINVHYNPTINAIDSRGMQEALAGHGDFIANLLQQRMREFRS